MVTIKAFFQNQGTFFDFQKWAREASPIPLLPEQLQVWLNTHQYPWISLNILENAWVNCSDYARTLNIPDHLICYTGFWRWLRLSIWVLNIIVYIRASTIPLKNTTLSFLPSPFLNQQTVQAPLFRQPSTLYIGFLWPPPPQPKSWIFQWTPKILKFFILNTILSLKVTKF